MVNKSADTTSKQDNTEPRLDMSLPEHFPVSVILESHPAKSQWIDTVWKAVAVTVGKSADRRTDGSPRLIRTSGDIRHYQCSGLQVALFKDECESYYHNLMSPTPRCYVVTHVEDTDSPPEPFLVTMSFDEAHAYLEGEDDIFDVDVPPELYRWTEAFVLVHYAPEKRTKRKLDNWKQQDSENPSS